MKDARPSIKTESSATVEGAPIVSPFGFPVKLGTCLHCGLPKDFHKREAVEELEADQKPRKHTIEDLIEIRNTYRAKAKEIDG